MLECKDKEQAVFYIYRLYNLQEVDPKVLRPPADVETLQTKGRKSHKRAKANAENNDGEGEGETDVTAIGTDGDDAVHTAGVNGDERLYAHLAPQLTTTEGDKDKVKEELIREAEEHAAPLPEVVRAIDSAMDGSGLDCGSGDEEVEVEGMPKERERRSKKKKPLAGGEVAKKATRGRKAKKAQAA